MPHHLPVLALHSAAVKESRELDALLGDVVEDADDVLVLAVGQAFEDSSSISLAVTRSRKGSD